VGIPFIITGIKGDRTWPAVVNALLIVAESDDTRCKEWKSDLRHGYTTGACAAAAAKARPALGSSGTWRM
jgi:hypothetical protein